MVCLGNICRSPIAEGVLRHKVTEHGLDWVVDSAGTESYHIGEAPHRSSQKVCREHGIDISNYCARRFKASDLVRYDRIYAFADDVYREIKRIGGPAADMSRVDYFLNELFEAHVEIPHFKLTKNASVPDPYYGAEADYRLVYELVDKTCDAIIARYKNK
jgi:protein-tyrosine phosphatase